MKGNHYFFTPVIPVTPKGSQEYFFEFNDWTSNTLFFNLNRNSFLERNTYFDNLLDYYLFQKISPLKCQFYFLFFIHWKYLYRQTCVWRHLAPKITMWTQFQPQH